MFFFEKFHCNHPGLLRKLFWEFPASNPLYNIYYSFWCRYTFASNYVVITFKAFQKNTKKLQSDANLKNLIWFCNFCHVCQKSSFHLLLSKVFNQLSPLNGYLRDVVQKENKDYSHNQVFQFQLS